MILQTPFQVTVDWTKGKQITQAEFPVFTVDSNERGWFNLSLVVESRLKLRNVGTLSTEDFHQAKKGNDSNAEQWGENIKGRSPDSIWVGSR